MRTTTPPTLLPCLLLLALACSTARLETSSSVSMAPARMGRMVQGLEGARSLSRTFQRVSSDAAPAVVRIEAFRMEPGERIVRLGEGTGFVVKEDGVLLTNHHVVRGAEGAMVSFNDGSQRVATIVGQDEESDLAVLRIEAEGLEYLELRADEPAAVGEWVLALGNPLGLGHTVTAGIVSGKGRELDIGIVFEDFIQTDAAINPGNSGGPLLDLDGRVLGINTAMASGRVGQGIGFAIPADMAEQVLESILRTGRVQRGYLGVNIGEISTRDLAGIETDTAVRITRVEVDGPAAAAGLLAGDIVTAIGKQPIATSQQLLNTIGRLMPGTLVALEVWRGGERMELDIELADRSQSRLLRD